MSTDDSRPRAIGHVGILSHARLPIASRLSGLLTALAMRNVIAEPVVYADDVAQEVTNHLLRLDGVLVWVDPIVDGQDRSRLDEMLREVASRGVWVSAHPDVILKMGTKDVLVSTRQMGWGTDCHLYRTAEELKEQLPGRLASGPRVLKQHRGNGGNGVWKVELVPPADAVADALVQVLHAQRGSAVEDMRLGEFIGRCEQYFKRSGCMVDQPYQARLGDGMVRCYLVHDRVVGFCHQFGTALLPSPAGSLESPASHRRLYGPSEPEFQALKVKLESEWVPEMQRLLDLDVSSLPAIWDADFLYGPKMASGDDTYVLCEINVSAVFPFPDDAHQPLADAVARMLSPRRRAGGDKDGGGSLTLSRQRGIRQA